MDTGASHALYRRVWTPGLPTLTTASTAESSPGMSNLWSHCLHRGAGATLFRTVLQGDPFSQANPTAHVCTCPQVRMRLSTCQKVVGKEGERGGLGQALLQERQAQSYRKPAPHILSVPIRRAIALQAILSVFICLSSCLALSSHVSVSQPSHAPGWSQRFRDKLSLPPPPEARHAHARTQQKQPLGLPALHSLHFSSPRTCLIISLPVPKGV